MTYLVPLLCLEQVIIGQLPYFVLQLFYFIGSDVIEIVFLSPIKGVLPTHHPRFTSSQSLSLEIIGHVSALQLWQPNHRQSAMRGTIRACQLLTSFLNALHWIANKGGDLINTFQWKESHSPLNMNLNKVVHTTDVPLYLLILLFYAFLFDNLFSSVFFISLTISTIKENKRKSYFLVTPINF